MCVFIKSQIKFGHVKTGKRIREFVKLVGQRAGMPKKNLFKSIFDKTILPVFYKRQIETNNCRIISGIHK